MRILAVETATNRQSVALLDGNVTVSQVDVEAGGAHSRLLIPTIDRLLHSNEVNLSDLGGLAASVGPGSFSGLRVGLATMLGLRARMGLPLAGVPTLEAMAWNFRGTTQPLCPILKARTGEAYWAVYRWTPSGDLTCLVDARVGAIEQIAQTLQEPTIVLGEGWVEFRDELGRHLDREAVEIMEAPEDAMFASAGSVGRAGLAYLTRGETLPVGCSPRYVQRSEAEVNWERRTVHRRTVRGSLSPEKALLKGAGQGGRRDP